MTKKTKTKAEATDDLATAIYDGLNKDGYETFFPGMDSNAADLTDFISTGSSLLDIAISNRPYGGIACGRISEFSGLEGSGKSLICAHMMANVQNDGGVACLIDTENAFNEQFFHAVGVKMGHGGVVYRQPRTVEEVFETVDKCIELAKVKSLSNSKKVIIVIDSIAASPSAKELEGDYNTAGYGTDKAKIVNLGLRKLMLTVANEKIALVITNQLRQKMNPMPGSDPWVTTSGKAIDYATSTRVRLNQVKQLTIPETKEALGIKVKAEVKKNRLGPPRRVAEFNIYFDRGIDDIESWIDYLRKKELISGTGNYTFVDIAGNEHKFKRSTWKDFAVEHPDTITEIYNKMCESMILQYSSEGKSVDDGTLELSAAEEEE